MLSTVYCVYLCPAEEGRTGVFVGVFFHLSVGVFVCPRVRPCVWTLALLSDVRERENKACAGENNAGLRRDRQADMCKADARNKNVECMK